MPKDKKKHKKKRHIGRAIWMAIVGKHYKSAGRKRAEKKRLEYEKYESEATKEAKRRIGRSLTEKEKRSLQGLRTL